MSAVSQWIAGVPEAVEIIGRLGALPKLLEVLTTTTGLRLAAVCHVAEGRRTVCAAVDRMGSGLAPGDALDVDRGFESRVVVQIETPAGACFGELVGLDTRPVDVAPHARTMMALFAELLGRQLQDQLHAQLQDSLHAQLQHPLHDPLPGALTERAALDTQGLSRLREPLLAVLGHDLRTPLASIALGAEVLSRRNLPEATQKVIGRIQRSSGRLTRLADLLLDFTRLQLGDGLPLVPTLVEDVAEVARRAIEEQRAAHPERQIVLAVERGGSIHCDEGRVVQALSTLLANALETQPPDAVVELRLQGTDDEVSLSVLDAPPLSPDELAHVFEPVPRGERAKGSAGLAMYLVAEVARAHGGSAEARATNEGTGFTLRLPRRARDGAWQVPETP